MKILDASNRFYTLIPHDFGFRSPPLLNKAEMIKVDNAFVAHVIFHLISNLFY